MDILKKLTLQSHDRTIIKDFSKVLECIKKNYGLSLTDVLHKNEQSIDHLLELMDDIQYKSPPEMQQFIISLRRKLLHGFDQLHLDKQPVKPTARGGIEDRRNGVRQDIEIKVIIYSEYDGLICGRTLDVSMSGMRIYSEKIIADGTIVDIMITLPDRHGKEIIHTIRSLIASCQGGALGIMFVGVEQTTYDALEKYLESLH